MFYQANQDQGLTVITALRADSADEVGEWVSELGLSFPVLWDAEEAVFDMWKDGNGRPQYIVLDRELTEVGRGQGRSGHAEMETLAADLAAE